jgi:hypothetical protein
MITIEAKGLDSLTARLNVLPDKFRGRLFSVLLVESDKMVSYIKQYLLNGQLLNVQSGKLRDSIFQENIQNDANGVRFKVASGGNLPYARPQNDGIGPYIIQAVNAKALAFEVAGVMVFAKYVHHPGLKAKHYMETGLQHQKQDIIDAMQGSMKGAWFA